MKRKTILAVTIVLAIAAAALWTARQADAKDSKPEKKAKPDRPAKKDRKGPSERDMENLERLIVMMENPDTSGMLAIHKIKEIALETKEHRDGVDALEHVANESPHPAVRRAALFAISELRMQHKDIREAMEALARSTESMEPRGRHEKPQGPRGESPHREHGAHHREQGPHSRFQQHRHGHGFFSRLREHLRERAWRGRSGPDPGRGPWSRFRPGQLLQAQPRPLQHRPAPPQVGLPGPVEFQRRLAEAKQRIEPVERELRERAAGIDRKAEDLKRFEQKLREQDREFSRRAEHLEDRQSELKKLEQELRRRAEHLKRWAADLREQQDRPDRGRRDRDRQRR